MDWIKWLTSNYKKKILALVIAAFIWVFVDNTLTTKKTLTDIRVKVINIPRGKTIEGMQSNGYLAKKITLTLSGRKVSLDRIFPNDIEVIIDATGHFKGEWVETLSRNNLYSRTTGASFAPYVSSVSHKSIALRLTNIATARVPVFVTQPLGKPPEGYQFVDVWPYRLYITVKGSNDAVHRLKQTGVKISFNLNDISRGQLDQISTGRYSGSSDVISFHVPKEWKQVYVPSISNKPLVIDDPRANALRIDFIRAFKIPVGNQFTLGFFAPTDTSSPIDQSKLSFSGVDVRKNSKGIYQLNKPLYTKGVSQLFVETVKDMLQVTCMPGMSSKDAFDWSVVFMNAGVLEDRYVSTILSDTSDPSVSDLSPQHRQKYLRNRFRNFMYNLRLFDAYGKRIKFKFTNNNNTINISIPNEKESKKPS